MLFLKLLLQLTGMLPHPGWPLALNGCQQRPALNILQEHRLKYKEACDIICRFLPDRSH